MGLTFVEGMAAGKKGKKVAVKFFVDSGAAYSLLPAKDWQAIGLKPKRTMTFTLADGTEIQRGVSECYITLPQGDDHTPVILGEPRDEALLGAVTLEMLGLVLDPFKRTLRPMRGMLRERFAETCKNAGFIGERHPDRVRGLDISFDWPH